MLHDPVQLADIHASYQACVTLLGVAAQADRSQTRSQDLKQAVAVLRRCWNQILSDPKIEQGNPGLTIGVGCALGVGLQDAGDDRGALKVYNQIITAIPGDPDAWGLRGYLRWSTERNAARSDFEESIRRGGRSAVPYAFLARELLDVAPGEALKLVNAAETRLGKFRGPLGAVLHQIRAFSQLELKQPQAWILAEMDKAISLDPANVQIKSNRDAILLARRPILAATISFELARADWYHQVPSVQNRFAGRHETELAELFKQSA
jgi:hypothetical protein